MATSRNPSLVTVSAAREELGVSLSTVWRMIRKGELPTVRVGARRLVPVRALRARIARLRDPQIKPFTLSNPLWRLIGKYRSEGGPGARDKHAIVDE